VHRGHHSQVDDSSSGAGRLTLAVHFDSPSRAPHFHG
jgi:hypothetical protein